LTDSIHWRIQPIEPCRGCLVAAVRAHQVHLVPGADQALELPARQALVPDQGQSRPQRPDAGSMREQVRRHLAFADLGAGQAPGHRHPVRGGEQVQLEGRCVSLGTTPQELTSQIAALLETLLTR